MMRETKMQFNSLDAENQNIATDFIEYPAKRQTNRDLTMQVIEDAGNGIELSEPYDNVDDLMAALNS